MSYRWRLLSRALLRLVACSAVACSDTTEPGLTCRNPAPLSGVADSRAPGYIVRLREDVDATAEATRLASRFEFRVTIVYTALKGFAAEMSDEALAALRCEPTVLAVTHDGLVGTHADTLSNTRAHR